MNILIIENEIYLAQSIASKLSDLSHNCDISSSTKEGLRGLPYDVILLSTNISGQDIYPVIEAYKNAVVILMVSYVSNDTVSKPLAAGAKDYILKPFMIEELIRKIQHFQNHERLRRQNQTYERYLTHTFNSINVDEDLDKVELPLFICSGYQKYADAFAFRYAAHKDKTLQFISLASAKAFSDIATQSDDAILFITDFQNLKKSEHKAFYELITGKKCIVSSTDPIDNPPFKLIEIESESHLFDQGEILPIEEYVKYIMIHFQNRFPDTELSKKLGISRKSLWEKRKKYGIVKKNRSLYIDQEAVSALTLLKAGMLSPVTALMNEAQSKEVLSSGMFMGKTFPFPLILSPSGKVNETILTTAHKGEVLDLICDNVIVGELCVDEVYPIDPRERLRQIYGTEDLSHPGVSATYKRLGKFAICGDYTIDLTPVESLKTMISEAKEQIGAQHITALFMAANPLHRAHERLIRQSLERTDLIIIFLLKPYNNANLHYDLRYQTLEFFVENYLPQNRVVIIPLESSYIFAGSNEVILDAIVAKNYGCDRLMIGQNHAGIGMYYDHNANKSILDRLIGIDIEVGIASEYVYCNQCKTLVSIQTCPHGHHHHISYHSESILELMQQGLLPPAVLVRKEISAMIVASLYPNRFKNLSKLYYDIMPITGLLEEHTEKDFYVALMRLYQTTSLT